MGTQYFHAMTVCQVANFSLRSHFNEGVTNGRPEEKQSHLKLKLEKQQPSESASPSEEFKERSGLRKKEN